MFTSLVNIGKNISFLSIFPFAVLSFAEKRFMRIQELAESERPREKMLLRGANGLSDGELLAILIRTGTRDANALDLARKLLGMAGWTLTGLSRMPLEKIAGVKGLGKMKAVEIAAALEIGRRLLAEKSNVVKLSIISADMIYQLMIPELRSLDHEECWAVFLNRAHYVISRKRMSSGGSDATVVDIKQIIRSAIDTGAQHLIMVHNHPTGSPLPSQADIELTKGIQAACHTMDMSFLDHVIICDDSYYSFADERVVKAPCEDEP